MLPTRILRQQRGCGGFRRSATALHQPSNKQKSPVTIIRDESSKVDVHAWINGVPIERAAHQQLLKMSQMNEVIRHPIAAMPDIHYGQGATVGAVIPTTKAVIPAAVGVDIGCGMIAVRTSLTANDLPPNLRELRQNIELAVPHGRTHNGRSDQDVGGWRQLFPKRVATAWQTRLEDDFGKLCASYPELERTNNINHLGTLGTGNHFVEVCVELLPGDTGAAAPTDDLPSAKDTVHFAGNAPVWVMLHSGSRGVGNRIGMFFIDKAKEDMRRLQHELPDEDLAYLKEGSRYFDDYIRAVTWAQDYARVNRDVMLEQVIQAMRNTKGIPPFTLSKEAVNCHHNYVERGTISVVGSASAEEVWITRKGATSAKLGELGVIPGNMGNKSYIVRGKGNAASYNSCSHGAGRAFSRGEAKRRFTVEDHAQAVKGVDCRLDKDVVDETPMAYKNIDDVMAAQSDLVDIVHTIKQVLCVKG